MIQLALLGMLGFTAQAVEPPDLDLQQPPPIESVAQPAAFEPHVDLESSPVEASSWLLARPEAPSQELLDLHREWRTRRLELRSETVTRPSGA